jgi:outer membrane protein assembly factor BamD
MFYFRPVENLFNPMRIILLALLYLLMTACSSTPGKDDEESDITANWSAAKLYQEAKRELKAGDYELAVEYFESLEARFPFSKYAPQAQLETVYAYYKFEEYDMAISSADRFIKLHPRHANVDYAYYLKGIAAFHKKDTPLDFLAPSDPASKDPSSARESFNYFAELVKRYPDSKYAPDAIKRMRFQRNTLADHELRVADYYLKRGAYVAAANRSKYVVENYPQTPAVPSALATLAEAYTALKMHDLATDARQVLELNFPNFGKESVSHDSPSGEADQQKEI